MKKIFALVICLSLICGLFACTGENTTEPTASPEPTEEPEREIVVGTYDKFDLDTCMTPIWEGRVVHNETVMFIDSSEAVPLLYEPEEILSVRNNTLKKEYVKGQDYDLVDGKLVILEGSKMRCIGKDKYYSSGDAAYLKTEVDGVTKNLFFSEKFSQYQFSVTYVHNQYWGDKFKPTHDETQFSKIMEKLCKGEDVTLFFYGDSITYGANASMMMGSAPLMPTWPELVTMYLAEQFEYKVTFVDTKLSNVYRGNKKDLEYGTRGTITYINTAVGGWNSSNGIANYNNYVKKYIDKYGCDLFVLAFGMNDPGLSVEEENANIGTIADKIYAQNADTEIALLATMVPNPDTTNGWYANQEYFEAGYLTLAKEYQSKGKHCGVIQMTSMSKSILTVKRFRDYTGNNVNHPNDFFARVYAQVVYETVFGFGSNFSGSNCSSK